MSHTITIRADRVAGFTKGQEVKVEADAVGIPLDHFWVRRLRDAERDNCCEIVAAKSKKSRRTRQTSAPESDAKEEEASS